MTQNRYILFFATLLTLAGTLPAQTEAWRKPYYPTTDEQYDAEAEKAPQALCYCKNGDIYSCGNSTYYYCDCRMGASFAFPLRQVISDTTWFTASVNDLQQGMTAYWFSDCSVRMEVYATCASKDPTIALTIGRDQMREMDVESINKKIEEMGNLGTIIGSVLKPRIRVYPIGGGSGEVHCYPYDQGPLSTCDDLLPVRTSMTYISNHSEDVYQLQPATMPNSGQMYVQWKEKNNRSCLLAVRRSSCDGEVVAQCTLADSVRLFFPDPALIRSAKAGGQSLYFHFAHRSEDVGRIRFRSNPTFVSLATDTAICQGRGLQLADTLLTQTTNYAGDTCWLRGDSVAIHSYRLTITPPETLHDTLRLKSTDLPYIYRNQERIPQDGWGDYDLTIHTPWQCDTRYLLHVAHLINYTQGTIDTTLCEGKPFVFEGKTYTTDTTFTDSTWLDADTYSRMSIRVQFVPQPTEYDTIYPTQDELAKGYLYAAALRYIYAYGEYDFTVTANGKCTRYIHLVADKPITSATEEVPVAPKAMLYRDADGTIYIRRADKRYTLLGQQMQ